MILESGLEPSFQICLMKNTILTYILLRHLRWVYFRFWYFSLVFVTTIYNTNSFWMSNMVINLKQKRVFCFKLMRECWFDADLLQFHCIINCNITYGLAFGHLEATNLFNSHLSYHVNRFTEHLPVLWHLVWGFSGAMEVLDLGVIEPLLLQVKAVLVTYTWDFMTAVIITRYIVVMVDLHTPNK